MTGWRKKQVAELIERITKKNSMKVISIKNFETEPATNSSIYDGFKIRANSEVSIIPSSFVSRVPELAPF